MKCSYCDQTTQQVKVGLTASGSQQWKCKHCQRKYTPLPKAQGYPDALRQQAVQVYVDGLNFRRIARHLGVHHQTVINWVNAQVDTLPDRPPLPEAVVVVEQDELFTFVGSKKTKSM